MDTARVTSKGQITIPLSIRRKLNIQQGDVLEFVMSGERVEILRMGTVDDFYGSVKVTGTQDFKEIRRHTMKQVAGKIAHEGK